jgi:hypothetical protein
MTIVRVKGFQVFANRHGKMRCYHRKTKTPIDLAKAPLGSPEFFAECARIAELAHMVRPAKPGQTTSAYSIICVRSAIPLWQLSTGHW